MKNKFSPEMGYTEDRPLAEQVSEKIKQYIILNDLKDGDKMPTEPTLVEIFGVGRSTIREAVKILVSQNILNVRQGSGTYVSEEIGVISDPLGFSFIRDKNKLARDLLEVRGKVVKERLEKGIVTCAAELYCRGSLACTGEMTIAMR